MHDLAPLIIAFVTGAAVALAGAFVAAWLLHRLSTGQSPIPTLPSPIRLFGGVIAEEGKEPEKPPYVRL